MALLSRLSVVQDSLGKRKREVDTGFSSPLKKLASNAAIRGALTTFPASPYLNRMSKNGPFPSLSSAPQLSNSYLPSARFASRPLHPAFQQPSPIFHPESIASNPRAHSDVPATAVTVLTQRGPRHANGNLDLGRRGGSTVSGEEYRTARLQAQLKQLQEHLHMVHKEVVQLQSQVRGSEEKKQSQYGEIVQKVRESADLRKQVMGAQPGVSAEKGKAKMLEGGDVEETAHEPSEARENAEDRGKNTQPAMSIAQSLVKAACDSFAKRVID